MKTRKQKEPLFDCLGREIEVGAPVAFFHRGHGQMKTGRVSKITRVNVTITWESRYGEDKRSIKASDVVLLEEEHYVFHVLKSG
jgi:hypothetical protein